MIEDRYARNLTPEERAEYVRTVREVDEVWAKYRTLVMRREALKRKAMGIAYRFQLSGEPT